MSIMWAAIAQADIIDSFEDLSQWRVYSSKGVDVEIAQDAGVDGMGMRLDFDFHGSGGFIVARRALALKLPDNYKFSYKLRGEALQNNIEFKLVDPRGENVWWKRQVGFDFPKEWTAMSAKKRHFKRAWGTKLDTVPSEIGSIEIAITSGMGGKGSIWIDQLEFEARTIELADLPSSTITASTTDPKSSLENLWDVNPETYWHSGTIADEQWLQIDFGRLTEFGGLVIDWDATDYARSYEIELSNDGRDWTTAYTVEDNSVSRSYVYLPDTESRLVRVNLKRSSQGDGYSIASLSVKPYQFSATPNDFFSSIARDSRPGFYPRYFLGEQTYWTVAGAAGGQQEALINEDGMVEVKEGAFSIEPFLHLDGRFLTSSEVERTQALVEEYLPIPSVAWRHDGLGLTITPLAAGNEHRSRLLVRYEIANFGSVQKKGHFYLAARPFQVNPPWQSLNVQGGVGRINEISIEQNRAIIDGTDALQSLTPIDYAGAANFEQGDISAYLQQDRVPSNSSAKDSLGRVSAALQYRFDLAPGESKTVYLTAPMDGTWELTAPHFTEQGAEEFWQEQFAATRQFWERTLNLVEIDIPDQGQKLFNLLRATLAYILINQDGPAIQPGSRDYARSWIRDGAITSNALLAMGHTTPVRRFIEWYANHQTEYGKIPCCVDKRGADPVPENDSNGQWIYLVMQYYRYTRDIGFLTQMWPSVQSAVDYMEALRRTRLTDEFRQGEKLLLLGLMPESISHEGYSARPVHSYWDDFFALRGYKDATEIATILNEQERAEEYRKARDEFRRDLYVSIAASMNHHGVDFIPGAAELGDFDATSTAIAVDPVGELEHLPAEALARTFDAYYAFFEGRLDEPESWEAYTPYEMRIVSTLIQMGQNSRAYELVDFLFDGLRPAKWLQWAEVVWRDVAEGSFIGDMPHTWVGAEYIRAIRTMLVYERENDQALVIAAGVRPEWLDTEDGVGVKRLPTQQGALNYRLWQSDEQTLQLNLTGDLSVPPGGIVIRSPLPLPISSVTVNGNPHETFNADEVRIDTFPARVEISHTDSTEKGEDVASAAPEQLQ